ncbi:hypothetical protein FB107DRAFT_294341 [Schizophyllum commune]
MASPFRPLVLARDRLAVWSSPHASAYTDALMEIFPAHLSVSEETRKNYGAGLIRFAQFCDRYCVPEQLRMPASEALLSLFVAEMGAGKVHLGTVESWLAALALWHEVNGAQWKGGRVLSRTKKGVANVSSQLLHRRPPRNPVSYPHMVALRRHLDLSNTFDSAVWAVACSAWRGCCRLGELVPISDSSFHPRRNMCRGTGMKAGTTPGGSEWISLFAPFTKTKGFDGEWLNFTASADNINVVTALRNHWTVNAGIPPNAPMFAFETTSGWSSLTKDAFLGRCQEIWDSVGLGSILGHGFRIGGTTFLLLQGRWSSKAFLRYWRNVEEILPIFIGDRTSDYSRLAKSIGESIHRMGA